MSVYKNDRPKWLSQAIDSILHQTYTSIDFFIAVDGPISSDLRKVLIEYDCNKNVHIHFFDECKGLASRLNFLIDTVISIGGFEYIARMDADDISKSDRIEKQVNILSSSNANCDVLGSSVIEINDDGEPVFEKKMYIEHEQLVKNIILRCPFNHPTVMFRCSIFVDGIRYDSRMKNTQDYQLWITLVKLGYRFSNTDESLLYFRVSSDFHSRRSFSKANNDFLIRVNAMRILSIFTIKNITHTIALYLIRVSPSFISKIAYRYFR
ncbi:glycosyltransferase [Aeromonas salmonicida subsp. pectinolytica]